MATEYKQISCPKCGKHIYSAFISSSGTNRTVVTCIHCNIKYRIEYGCGKAKVTKA